MGRAVLSWMPGPSVPTSLGCDFEPPLSSTLPRDRCSCSVLQNEWFGLAFFSPFPAVVFCNSMWVSAQVLPRSHESKESRAAINRGIVCAVI
jgi:hypothetical protein